MIPLPTPPDIGPTPGTPRHFRGTPCLALAILLCHTACTMPQRNFNPDRNLAGLDDTTFLHALANVPVVTVDEGMRGIVMLVGEHSRRGTFESLFERCRRRGAVKVEWDLRSGQLLDKGTLAYMLRTICKLSPSLGEQFAERTGLGDRRYALKTCMHEGLMQHGLPHEPVTGGELLSAITRAERFLPTDPQEEP